MERSYLIQRLQKPLKNDQGKIDKIYNAFAFGGGLKNGGLDDNTMSFLSKVWRFDYMGSAEFEFGKVTETLGKIYENSPIGLIDDSTYISGEMIFDWEFHNWNWGNIEATRNLRQGKAIIYYICQQEHEKEVKKRISKFAKGKGGTKEPIMLNFSLAKKDSRIRSVGWLELNNGYFFFINEEMFKQTCELFGIKDKNIHCEKSL